MTRLQESVTSLRMIEKLALWQKSEQVKSEERASQAVQQILPTAEVIMKKENDKRSFGHNNNQKERGQVKEGKQ